MKKILLILLVPFILFAEKIPLDRAQEFALGFMGDFQKDAIADFKVEYLDEEAMVYLFNFKENGYLILSADDAAFPVIGFSENSRLDFGQLNPALTEYINNYKDHIYKIRENQLSNAATKSYWTKRSLQKEFVTQSSVSVEPLLNSRWGQEYPYNKFCPEDEAAGAGYNYRVPAGCVAVAMAQIMNYWEYPKRGVGEHSYEHEDYGYQYANFDTLYHWQNMPDVVQQTAADSLQDAVAQLIYHCGVAVEMGYGPDGSGAYSQDAIPVMKNNFLYNDAIKLRFKDYMTEADWISELQQELVENRPVYYAGSGDDGGHAFVFDGYREEEGQDFFHVNWGWSGSGNGWYTVNKLNPDDMEFNEYQRSIIYIEPAVATARFVVNTQVGLEPLEVQFTDQSTGVIEKWHWEFGDGDTSSLQNPVHIYEEPGYYDVKLTVTDTAGYVSEPKVLQDLIFVKARDELYGQITGTRTLKDDTVKVLNNVEILSDGELIITPGVHLEFHGNYELVNYGYLEAEGTADSMVTFSAKDTAGFSDLSSNAGGWKGIRTQKSAGAINTTILKYCKISHVKNQNVLSAINQVSLRLKNVELIDNAGPAIYNVASAVELANVKISNTNILATSPLAKRGSLIASYSGETTLKNVIISGNKVHKFGLFNLFSSDVNMINSTIYENEFTDKNFLSLNLDLNSELNIINSILWNRGREEFSRARLPQMVFKNSIIKTDLYNYEPEVDKWADNITTHPQLNAQTFAPYAWSPCVNAGTPDTAGLKLGASDLAGNDRVQEIIDIGAIEFTGEKSIQEAGFAISANSGYNPLTVNFADTAGYKNIAWDFDNDGAIDSEKSDTSWCFYEPGLHISQLIAEAENDSPVVAVHYIRVFNSAPELLVESMDTLIFNEDESDSTVNLYGIFRDPADEPLTYTVSAGHIDHEISDSTLFLLPEENYFGQDVLNIVATDPYDSSAGFQLPVRILPVNDKPVLNNFPDSLSFTVSLPDSLKMNDFVTDADNDLKDIVISWNLDDLVMVERRDFDNESFLMFTPATFAGESVLNLVFDDGSDTVSHNLKVSVLDEVAIDENIEIISDYHLGQNYPNPFNPSTIISYSLPEPGHVNLTVYDIRGTKIFSLVDEFKNKGNFEVVWRGMDHKGNIVPAGVYLYKLDTDNFKSIRKMLFVK